MPTTIRKATEADIARIRDIVNHYAAQNLMLWRTTDQIRRVLSNFLVAEQEGQVVACGSLVELTPQLTELRSLAVAPEQRGTGLGRQLVAALVEEARAQGYAQLCALTLQEGFFNAQGFETVDRWTLSPKIWTECIYCPKFDNCDEIAVIMNLTEDGPGQQESMDYAPVLWQRLRLSRLIDQ